MQVKLTSVQNTIRQEKHKKTGKLGEVHSVKNTTMDVWLNDGVY